MSIIRYSTIETITAGISTRENGFSNGKYKSNNLGLNTKDSTENIQKNRNHFFTELPHEFSPYYAKQTHSAIIHNVDSCNFSNNMEGDGLYTTEKHKLLCISVADCGNILFYSENHPIVMAIHAGWRGARNGIIKEACSILAAHTPINTITAIVGPSIHCKNYEVGREFYEYFPPSFFSQNYGSIYFDLSAYMFSELKQNGIKKIIDYNLDTFEDRQRFFSYRRDGDTGRMITFIGRKD